MFQFLGRNSGRSDREVGAKPFTSLRFNSSVGILVVRTQAIEEGAKIGEVSIPRSEFWSFGRPAGRTIIYEFI